MQSYKSLAAVLGLSICGFSLYLFYKFWKKDEDDTLVKTCNFNTIEMNIPSEFVKDIIGREGCNIKKIEIKSGTRIYFKNLDGDRICVIRGSNEACHIARSLIKEFIENLPKIKEEFMYIPRGVTPKIIGRGGQNIHELRNLSGAKILISQESGDTSLSKVTIIGTEIQITLAKSLLQEKLQECIDRNSELELTLSKREPRGPPKSGSNHENMDRLSHEMGRRESLTHVAQNADGSFEVYVSALVNPSKFWIQIFGPKAAELDRLGEEINKFYTVEENKNLHLLKTIKKGDLVAAAFQYDDRWYRAEVLSVDEEKKEAELFYVDYGDVASMSFDKILELRTDFLRLHFQAIECYMHNVVPVNEEWSTEAVDEFEEWTYVAQWIKLSAKIKEYTKKENESSSSRSREGSPIPGIDLFDCSTGVSIADKLVDNKYAVYKNTPENKSNVAASSNSE